MSEAMIEAEGLSKRYGSFDALRDVSFQVNRGEVLGFLGPNGAGKTTTMKILTCFMAPSAGRAKVNGCDVLEDPIGARAAIGYLPESTPLYTDMLVYEYIEWAGKMRGLKHHALKNGIKRVVEETSLGDVLGKTISQLSKGYRQRVGLAQALIHEPSILILDEPMSGLDPNQAVGIRDLIRSIGKERTVILSTHNLSEVQVTCGRVLIIAKGRLVADDTPETLKARAGKARIVLDVLGEAAPNALGELPGVQSIDTSSAEGVTTFDIVPAGDDDLRPALFKACVDKQLTLVGLRQERENLEQIFRQLTTGAEDSPTVSGEQPAAPAAEAGAGDDEAQAASA